MNTEISNTQPTWPISSACRSTTDESIGSMHFGDEILEQVIGAACAAPSADNNQPWKFACRKSEISVFYDSERRLPSDQNGMFDLLSLGAVIENICLKLSALGAATKVELNDIQPQNLESKLPLNVATIHIDGKSSDKEIAESRELAEWISERCTNRLPFSRQIESSLLSEITESAVREDGVKIGWESSRKRIRRIARLVASTDSMRFRYRDFHEELHRQLRLSDQEANRTRDGLDYRTLGLPPGGRHLLRFLSPWRRMERLNRIGLAKLLSLPSFRLVQASGAIGFLFVPDQSTRSMIAGGRAMQRIWLRATSLGLSIHPLGSLPIFLSHQALPENLNALGRLVRCEAASLLPEQNGFLQMAFRIGFSKSEPAIRSQRRLISAVTLHPDQEC